MIHMHKGKMTLAWFGKIKYNDDCGDESGLNLPSSSLLAGGEGSRVGLCVCVCVSTDARAVTYSRAEHTNATAGIQLCLSITLVSLFDY